MTIKIGCVIQARMGSTRLPKKSMLPLAGEPLVYRVLQRVLNAYSKYEVILAIPNLREDDILAEQARRLDISCIRGDESNVAERFALAIKKFDLDVVIRIPADNYLTEPWAIELLIKKHLEHRSGFTTNIMPILNSGFPDGIGGEAFEGIEFLEKHSDLCMPETDEHVHRHFYDYKTELKDALNESLIRTTECPPQYRHPEYSFDINTISDYKFASKLYEALWDEGRLFSLLDAVAWIQEVQQKGADIIA